MKPLLLTIFLTTPAFADGIGEPAIEPEPVRIVRHADQDNGGLFPLKQPEKQPRPDTPDPVTEKPRMDKTTALATHGLGRGNWRGLPSDLQEVAKDLYRKEVKTGVVQDWSVIAKEGE